ncbi:MAG: hypothetical protein NT001_02445 [Candidatus Woesearchaeota archaeon]|nr:hypothetical protein [Candidatus Woesearchaeota archaeon]
MDDSSDTTIRVKVDVKKQLARLDFVGKEHSYNDIVLELIESYNKTKGDL